MIVLVEKGLEVTKNRYGVAKDIDYLANLSYDLMIKEIDNIHNENIKKNIAETFILSRKNKSCLKAFKRIAGLVIGFEEEKDNLWFKTIDMPKIQTMTIRPPRFEIIDVEKNLISVPNVSNNIEVKFDTIARRFYCVETNAWVEMPREFYLECYNKFVLDKKDNNVHREEFMKQMSKIFTRIEK